MNKPSSNYIFFWVFLFVFWQANGFTGRNQLFKDLYIFFCKNNKNNLFQNLRNRSYYLRGGEWVQSPKVPRLSRQTDRQTADRPQDWLETHSVSILWDLIVKLFIRSFKFHKGKFKEKTNNNKTQMSHPT